MGKLRTLFAAMMLLAVTSVAQAATLVSTDFTKGDTTGWVLNGAQVKVVDVSGDTVHPKALALTTDSKKGSETGVAWTAMKFKVPSFSFIADIQITHDASLGCPADGFAMSFANVDNTATVGPGGGSLGLFGSPKAGQPPTIPALAAFEVNEWRSQGLGTAAERNACTSGKNETFAFDVVNATTTINTRMENGVAGDPAKGGTKIGLTLPPQGMKILNGGFFRLQWNVAADGTMTTYATGLSDSNKQFKQVKVLEVKIAPALNPIGFEGRFGLSAATGGAFSAVDVAAVRIDSPMIAPL